MCGLDGGTPPRCRFDLGGFGANCIGGDLFPFSEDGIVGFSRIIWVVPGPVFENGFQLSSVFRPSSGVQIPVGGLVNGLFLMG